MRALTNLLMTCLVGAAAFGSSGTARADEPLPSSEAAAPAVPKAQPAFSFQPSLRADEPLPSSEAAAPAAPKAQPAFSFQASAVPPSHEDPPAPNSAPLTFQAEGVALEIAMAGLFTGDLIGGVLFGWKSDSLSFGGALNFSSTSTSRDSGKSKIEDSASSFQIGPGVRFIIVRSPNEKAEIYGQVDAGLAVSSVTETKDGAASSAALAGFFFRAGPGVRYWLHPNIALGYSATIQGTFLGGSTEVKAGGATGPSVDYSTSVFKLGGALQLLAVF